jgi:cellulose synthase/poly-beta-1,6-N-acetylglucosamine synthase-like glycosyltransferase
MYNRHKTTTKVHVSRQLRYRSELKLFLGFILALFLVVIPVLFIWVFFSAGFGFLQIGIFSILYYVIVTFSFIALITGRLKKSAVLPINWDDGDIGFNVSMLAVLIITFYLLPFTLYFVLYFIPEAIKIGLIIIFILAIYIGLHVVFNK